MTGRSGSSQGLAPAELLHKKQGAAVPEPVEAGPEVLLSLSKGLSKGLLPALSRGAHWANRRLGTPTA